MPVFMSKSLKKKINYYFVAGQGYQNVQKIMATYGQERDTNDLGRGLEYSGLCNQPLSNFTLI